jgi:hypothetical protein
VIQSGFTSPACHDNIERKLRRQLRDQNAVTDKLTPQQGTPLEDEEPWEWEGFIGEKDLPPRTPSEPAAKPALIEPQAALTVSPTPLPPEEEIDFGVTRFLGGPAAVGSNPKKQSPGGNVEHAKPTLPPATRLLDINRALTVPPPPRDFSLPCLRAGTVGGLVSPGGAGKSMLAAQLAVMVATGLDAVPGLLGKPGWETVKIGRVHYASFEDGEEDAGARLHSVWSRLGPAADANSLKTAAANLSVETLTGLRPADLLDSGEWADWLLHACENKRLVLIDTLRMAHLGDENDSGSMARLMAVMQGAAMRTGTAVLFLHHISKGAASSGQGSSQQAARGSSVITDNARGQFFLAPMSEDDSSSGGSLVDFGAHPALRATPLHGNDLEGRPMRGRYVSFGVSKTNYAAPWPDVWLRRESHGVLACADIRPQSGSSSSQPVRKGSGGATYA